MSRYDRQICLPDMGENGQAKLKNTHITIVGLGGLGCPVLQYLAGAGVGHVTLIDPDCIEESNLHRQPLYRMGDLGKYKAEVAGAFVRDYNPDVNVTVNTCALTPHNAPDIIDASDVVIDAADSFSVSYILSDVCFQKDTALISASVLGLTGYVGGFCDRAPSLRAVFPDLPASSANCATAGVLGPVVGTLGALQAQMALQVALGYSDSVLGQMVTADLSSMRFSGFSFMDSPEPEHSLPFIAKNNVQANDLVVDLRDEAEAPQTIVPQAVRLSLSEVETLAIQSQQRVILCCQSGLRAWRAAKIVQENGAQSIALLAARAC